MSFQRFISFWIVVSFFLTTLGPLPKAHADADLGLPAPGTMINLSPAYEPVIIKGLTVHKDNPFLFDFIVDVGQDRMSGEPLKKEGEKLIKYFLASLAIPDKDVWVNLSPYEKNKMIPGALGQTDMGRDLLEQDYILKQITASLIYPEKKLGKSFWDRVYAKAQAMYGTTQVPVNTFNKVWIMADRAEVFEHNQTAFVVDCHLKVMLEEDYLALQKHPGVNSAKDLNKINSIRDSSATPQNDSHYIASQIVREIVLPELENEVNHGRNFANLRQIANSMILANWYKKSLKQALLNQVYSDKEKVKGINLQDPTIKEQIYQRYLAAYKKGVFNFIKEDVDQGTTVPRKYFSGGFEEGAIADPKDVSKNAAMASQIASWGEVLRRLVNFSTGLRTPSGGVRMSRRAVVLGGLASLGLALAASGPSYASPSKAPTFVEPNSPEWEKMLYIVNQAADDSTIKSDPENEAVIKALKAALSSGFYNDVNSKFLVEPNALVDRNKPPGLHINSDLIKKFWGLNGDNPLYRRVVFSALLQAGAGIGDRKLNPDFYLELALLGQKRDLLTQKGFQEGLKAYVAVATTAEAVGLAFAIDYLNDANGNRGGLADEFDAQMNKENDPKMKFILGTDALFLRAEELMRLKKEIRDDFNFKFYLLAYRYVSLNIMDKDLIDYLEGNIRDEFGPGAVDELHNNPKFFENPSLRRPFLFLGDPKSNGQDVRKNIGLLSLSSDEAMISTETVQAIFRELVSTDAQVIAPAEWRVGVLKVLLEGINDMANSYLDKDSLSDESTIFNGDRFSGDEGPYLPLALSYIRDFLGKDIEITYSDGTIRMKNPKYTPDDMEKIAKGKKRILTQNGLTEIVQRVFSLYKEAEEEAFRGAPDMPEASFGRRSAAYEISFGKYNVVIRKGEIEGSFTLVMGRNRPIGGNAPAYVNGDPVIINKPVTIGVPMGDYGNVQIEVSVTPRGLIVFREKGAIVDGRIAIVDGHIAVVDGHIELRGVGGLSFFEAALVGPEDPDAAMRVTDGIRVGIAKHLGPEAFALSMLRNDRLRIAYLRDDVTFGLDAKTGKVTGVLELKEPKHTKTIIHLLWNAARKDPMSELYDVFNSFLSSDRSIFEQITYLKAILEKLKNYGFQKPESTGILFALPEQKSMSNGKYLIGLISRYNETPDHHDTIHYRFLPGGKVINFFNEGYRESGDSFKDFRKIIESELSKLEPLVADFGNAAMRATSGRDNAALTQGPGGIDLNTSNGMRWKINKDGKGVEMNVDPAMIERVRREGIDSLSPVIFRITPITSIWPLVGLQAPAR